MAYTIDYIILKILRGGARNLGIAPQARELCFDTWYGVSAEASRKQERWVGSIFLFEFSAKQKPDFLKAP